MPAKAETFARAFPEKSFGAPLDPKQAAATTPESYQWGYEPISMGQTHGQRTYNEVLDSKNHQVPVAKPFPVDSRGFHPMKPADDRINESYDHQLGDDINKSGPGKARFATGYQKDIAYHSGVYVPERHNVAQSADDVRLAVSAHADKVLNDNPDDGCKWLAIEEFRCLRAQQFETNPVAATRCAKWFHEWQQCNWDQHKFDEGITYIEGPQQRRRRPYVFYPEFKFA